MRSNKPYLIRAFYEWIIDNQCIPFLVVNAEHPRCKVPTQFVENGQITLNISPDAIRDLKISNELIEFRASFSGVVHIISTPIKAVLAIYAQENGEGMFFDFEEHDDERETETKPQPDLKSNTIQTSEMKKRSSHLKLVE